MSALGEDERLLATTQMKQFNRWLAYEAVE